MTENITEREKGIIELRELLKKLIKVHKKKGVEETNKFIEKNKDKIINLLKCLDGNPIKEKRIIDTFVYDSEHSILHDLYYLYGDVEIEENKKYLDVRTVEGYSIYEKRVKPKGDFAIVYEIYHVWNYKFKKIRFRYYLFHIYYKGFWYSIDIKEDEEE